LPPTRNQGQVALIGLVLVAIGGSCLWADFFDVTAWFARGANQKFDDFNPVAVVVERPKNHRTNRDGLRAGAFVDQENSQAGDADEGHVLP
jgi:hypothetical protein